MNDIIHNYAINAQLSYAAYADLEGVDPLDFDELVNRLKSKIFLDPPMSEAQALDFLGLERLGDGSLSIVSGKGFEIIDHYVPTSVDFSGFSATVFRNRETGEYHFVNRGTEILSTDDLANDINAVFTGGADEQIIAMLNYYIRLITSAGESAVQVIQNGNSFVTFAGQVGLGLLDANTPLNVSGHSLGGHLTDAFIKAFPTIGGIATEAFTYNGLGIGGGLDDLLNNVAGLYGITPDTTSTNEDYNVTNLIAEPGIILTPNIADNQLGQDFLLFIEDQGVFEGNVLVGNHSVALLADAMAVYDLFAAVAPVSEAETNAFLTKTLPSNYRHAELLYTVDYISGRIRCPSDTKWKFICNICWTGRIGSAGCQYPPSMSAVIP